MATQASLLSWSSLSEMALVQDFPLHRACRDGDITSLMNLLQHKDSTTLCSEDTYYGWTPLHWAAYFGKLDCLRALLQASNPGIVNLKTSRFNQTPAHIASFADHPHCLRWLVQAGADVNVKDYLDETPLHKAARSGSVDCVSLLCSYKALTNIENVNKKTASDLARLCDHSAVVNFLANLPVPESSVPTLVSSNGYYGYQPLNGSISKDKLTTSIEQDMEMDTEDGTVANPVNGMNGFHPPGQNGFNPPQQNGFHPPRQNGFNPPGHQIPNGLSAPPTILGGGIGFNNASPTRALAFPNRVDGDITLDRGVSKNQVLIAGKKRSREEPALLHQTKRIRTEDFSASSLTLKKLASCNAHPTEEYTIEKYLPPASLPTLKSPNSVPFSERASLFRYESRLSLIEANSDQGGRPTINAFHPGTLEGPRIEVSANGNIEKVGGSGCNITNPIPLLVRSSLGYMNTGNECIDARPKCLMGHYI